MTLKTDLACGIAAALQSTTIDYGTASFALAKAADISMADGTGNSQADVIHADQVTIGDAATIQMDLAGGLNDPLGVAVTFAKVKSIFVRAAGANTTSLAITPAAANGFLGPFNAAADEVEVAPGGCVMLAAPVGGWTVTPTAADLLEIVNGAGATATYDVVIVGTSA